MESPGKTSSVTILGTTETIRKCGCGPGQGHKALPLWPIDALMIYKEEREGGGEKEREWGKEKK